MRHEGKYPEPPSPPRTLEPAAPAGLDVRPVEVLGGPGLLLSEPGRPPAGETTMVVLSARLLRKLLRAAVSAGRRRPRRRGHNRLDIRI